MALIAIERSRCESRLRGSWFHSSLPCFKNVSDNNPVNMPDPLRKRFGYGQLWPLRPVMAITASVQPESGWIVYMPDPTSRIRFSSVFTKKAWITLCKTDPDPIWMAWSGFGQTHLVWKQAGVQDHRARFLAGLQPARCQFSSDF